MWHKGRFILKKKAFSDKMMEVCRLAIIKTGDGRGWEKYMGRIVKKSIAAVVVAFLLALVMEWAVGVANPPLYHYEFNGETQSEFTAADIEAVGYDQEGGLFVPSDIDPQLFVAFPQGQQTASVRIAFETPLEDLTDVQLFYPDEYGGFSELNSALRINLKGTDEVVLNFPAGEYPELRIDIDGSFALKSIETSASPAQKIVTPEPWNLPRMMGMFAVLAIVIFLLLYFNVFGKIKGAILKAARVIRENPKRTLKVVLITAVIMIGFCLLAFGACKALHKTPVPVYFAFAASFGFVLSMFILFFKYTGKKPEYFFLAIFLSAALLLACFTPTTLALSSWDDETHYAKMQGLSYFGEDARVTTADAAFIGRAYPQTFSIEEQNAIYEKLDEQYTEGAPSVNSDNQMSYEKLGYVPSAVSMFLARMFQMSFHDTLVLGRIAILVVFALLCFLAIRKLKSGKMILILLALLPTNVFLASHFSYDPWVTGFTILGFAWFFGELQEPDKPLTVGNWIIMLAALAVGMGPKAIYFPMIALLFFMPKTKFRSQKTCLIYRLSVLLTMFVVLLTFLLPVLTSGMGAGDARGGSGVNSAEQLAYILNNPFSFIKMMAIYLPQYLSIGNAQMYMTSFAYLGDGAFYGILLVLLAVVVFTDRNEYDRFTTTVPHKLRTLFAALVTVVCVATVLYISFTPVGFDTVNGCQARYLMPVIFPVLYVIGTNKISNRMNRNTYNTIVFSISGLVLFFNIGYMLLGRYFLAN